MSLKRNVRARCSLGIAAAIVALLTVGCNDPFNPCSDFPLEDAESRKVLMDGVWTLFEVDGNQSSNGFTIPGSTDRLRSGDLNFTTLTIDKGDCEEPEKSSGEVWAYYKIAKSNGTLGQPQIQVGRYEYEGSLVTLHALDSTKVGSVSTTGGPNGEGLLLLIGPIPTSTGTANHILKFAREPVHH